MIATVFSTPREAEQAFYRAFERADLAEMMAAWAEEEDIVCIHPGAARRAGVVEVRESWRQIFASGQRLKFRLTATRTYAARTICVHSVFEHVAVLGEQRPATPLVATNIYVLTERGWRLYLHHASPIAPEGAPEEMPPSVLH
jgi:ketosteroid isomerase-like protein